MSLKCVSNVISDFYLTKINFLKEPNKTFFFLPFAEPRKKKEEKKTKAQRSRLSGERSLVSQKAITDNEIEMQPEFRVTNC